MDKTVAVPSQVSLMAQILKLTQEDKIRWKLGGPDSIGEGFASDRVDAVFVASYKGTNLKLISVANKNYLAELATVLNQSSTSGSQKDTAYYKSNVLELVDEQGKVVWRFPRLDILDDLETAIRYQVANIKGFIDNIFAEA